MPFLQSTSIVFDCALKKSKILSGPMYLESYNSMPPSLPLNPIKIHFFFGYIYRNKMNMLL